MDEGAVIQVEDVVPVRGRVSWAAIFAGAVIALAVYLVLTLLGSAIGLTVSDNVRGGTLATGAGVWAVLTTVVALFAGGWIVSQCTVGENKTEAVVHGVIMWGVVLFMILWLVGAGMRAGFNAMWGVASFTNAATQDMSAEDWESAARRAGVPQESIDEWRRKVADAPATARQTVEDPANREAAARYATRAAWYTLIGTVFSMAGAIGGALVGAGPSLRLLSRGGAPRRVSYEGTRVANRV